MNIDNLILQKHLNKKMEYVKNIGTIKDMLKYYLKLNKIMIKKEHYAISHTGGFGFNKDFYLLDYNPGYGLNKKSIFTKSLS
ncbi:hypothetical protein H6A68_08695, partial [Bifidobacterium pullorum subsp. saeculare]|nr:hypothetical protein [Bifidobacterium pullorum subsp. saeculare]